MYTIVESLQYTLETNLMLYGNYAGTEILKKKLKDMCGFLTTLGWGGDSPSPCIF